MKAVIDASFLASVVLPDELSTKSTNTLTKLVGGGLTAPALWQIEITNLLVMAERRKRITQSECQRLSEAIDALPIAVQPPLTFAQRAEVLNFARTHKLTAYDATYLELAARSGLGLATHDADLMAAARACGVVLF